MKNAFIRKFLLEYVTNYVQILKLFKVYVVMINSFPTNIFCFHGKVITNIKGLSPEIGKHSYALIVATSVMPP